MTKWSTVYNKFYNVVNMKSEFYKNKLKNNNKISKATKSISDVEFNGNRIVFHHLNHHMSVSYFLRGLKKYIRKGIKNFELDFSGIDNQIFPNAVVPIAAIIKYYTNSGIVFQGFLPPALEKMNFLNPVKYNDSKDALNKLWTFKTSEDVAILVDAYILHISKLYAFPKGFLNATEWALNEVMDNVIQHSNAEEGFVMGQLHPKTSHIAFTVFDLGQGIFNSFKGSKYHPRNAVDAITLALQEEITRDKRIGQGNGLFGLSSLIKQGDSRLKITSGSGYYSYQYGSSKTFNKAPIISDTHSMTSIDFMLDYSKDVSIEEALVFNGKKYIPTSLRIENMEDINGNIYFRISEKSNGTGTREAAILLKNQIINILNDEPKIVILDFSGISVVSSSYSDELIAKLFCDLGLFQFNNLIRIKGLSQEQQLILQKSVIQRIIENFNKTN